MRIGRRHTRDYEAAVGGHWDEVGTAQFEFLRRHGLEPRHTLLDVPCGSFRLGRLVVPYLDRGNYIGVEADEQLMRVGRREVLGRALVRERAPRLIARTMPAPLPPADIGWCHALTDHIPPADVRETIGHLAQATPTFYVSFFVSETPSIPERRLRQGSEDDVIVTYHDREHWHHSTEFITACADAAGVRASRCDDYDHPLGLTIFEFRRA